MKDLSVRWQKLIVWLTGYLTIIAFVVAGGYLYQKTEHEEIKSSVKIALIVTAVFTAVDIIRTFLQYCLNLASSSSSWLSTTSWVIALIKIIVFVVLFIVDFTVGFGRFSKDGKSDEKKETADEETEESQKP